MARFTGDAYYDPPDEPETTLEQDLIAAVDEFMELHSKWGSSTCMMKEASDILAKITGIRDEMRADELPEYDDAAIGGK